MSGLEDLLRHPATIRLGWALVHFLWQGTAVALVLWMVLRALRGHPAQTRYAIACGALALLAIFPVITFALLPQRTAAMVPVDNTAAHVGGSAAPIAVQGSPVEPMSQPGAIRFRHAAERLLPWLVAVWAAGVVMLSLRLAGGYMAVQYARWGAIEPSGRALQRRLGELTRKMGVKRAVRLMQSAHVSGPAVVGILKPVILFPAAALTGLWPIQIEAILAHELAHIRRHDFAINLLQSVVETLLFYHPAVWWISGRIRCERENCCDDVAAQMCGDRVFYARSLAELDELRPALPALAMAATGGGLLPRIRRILNLSGSENRIDAWTGGTLAAALALAMLLVFLPRWSAARQPRAAAAAAPVLVEHRAALELFPKHAPSAPKVTMSAVAARSKVSPNVSIATPAMMPAPQLSDSWTAGSGAAGAGADFDAAAERKQLAAQRPAAPGNGNGGAGPARVPRVAPPNWGPDTDGLIPWRRAWAWLRQIPDKQADRAAATGGGGPPSISPAPAPSRGPTAQGGLADLRHGKPVMPKSAPRPPRKEQRDLFDQAAEQAEAQVPRGDEQLAQRRRGPDLSLHPITPRGVVVTPSPPPQVVAVGPGATGFGTGAAPPAARPPARNSQR